MYGRGHEQGTRKQRKPANPWWAEIEEAAIRKVETEWAAQQLQASTERSPHVPRTRRAHGSSIP